MVIVMAATALQCPQNAPLGSSSKELADVFYNFTQFLAEFCLFLAKSNGRG
jgi:hypothetical protein